MWSANFFKKLFSSIKSSENMELRDLNFEYPKNYLGEQLYYDLIENFEKG